MPLAELTDEQKLARDTRDVSIGVSAGAGCGKTRVLTDRFLSHLDRAFSQGEDPAQLRQLIAITFTDAAAREMRTRIRDACYERLQNPKLSDEEQAEWQRLLREIDTARVSTIHAFCTALLRTHAAEAGLDPAFGVLEQSEAELLLYETLDEVLRAKLAEGDSDTLDLAAAFGRLSQLKQRLVLLVNQRHQPAFAKWQGLPVDEATRADELLANWKACHTRDALRFSIQRVVEKASIAEMLRLLATATPKAGNAKFVAAIATLSDILTRLQSRPLDITRADLEAIVENARVQTICKKDDWPSVADFEKYKTACTKLRDAIKKDDLPWDDASAREAALLGLKLLQLAADVADAYQRQKAAVGKLDFDDLLARAHQLLTDPSKSAIRERLSSDLHLLLVDEFQDTDPLQIELIKAICGAGFHVGRLFFVGDFKQSIYRFRGAVPPEFLKLRDEVPPQGKLQLTQNFRSQPGILHFVNGLFSGAFSEYDALRPNRRAATKAPAVEFLWTIVQRADTQQRKGKVEAARRAEAAAVARRLRQLIDDECAETPIVDKDTGQPRRVRPGDVAILFRALSDVRLFEEALREQGLEYYLVGGHAFYAQQEIYDVLNLLRAVSSAADEISLAGVLRSPFFALADESLFWLVERGGGLNAGLFAETWPAELADEERAKVAAAAETLRYLRSIKDRVPVAELLGIALDRTAYDAAVVAEFLGERKLANLQKLVEQARVADSGGSDLNDFITQLAEFIAQPPKEPLASTSPETADVIRLMTIHRAKGLEFPLVVVPDLDRPLWPDWPDAALDPELGPLVRIPKEDGREGTVTGMSLFAARERGEELEERKRLLYVACTRAADYLILSSSVENLAEPKSDWMKLLADHFDLETGEYRAALPSGFERPAVHIAPARAPEAAPVGKSRGPDLLRLIEEAHQLAAEGGGIVPAEIAPIAIDRAAQRRFSFSRLTGQLYRVARPERAWSTATEDSTPFAEPQGVPPAPGATAGLPSSADLPTVVTANATAASQKMALDPRGFGSLVHDVLRRIDFANPTDVADWCEHLAPDYVVQNTAHAAQTARELIERFASGPRGRKLAAAAALHREIEFLLAWPGETVGGGRYFSGSIDCLYQDAEGAWRLVDYKTNDVVSENVECEAQRYEMQLYVYAMAVERSLGVAPSELILQFLRPGVEHKFPWNEAARQRATDMVNTAIEHAVSAPLQTDNQPLAPSP